MTEAAQKATAADQGQNFDYLFWWTCALCGGRTRSYIPYCQTVNCGAARWWAERRRLVLRPAGVS